MGLYVEIGDGTRESEPELGSDGDTRLESETYGKPYGESRGDVLQMLERDEIEKVKTINKERESEIVDRAPRACGALLGRLRGVGCVT